MISPAILALPRLGAWNMHGSLLPKYRGRAPVNWAVLHGEPRIGMTLHRMVKKADAGAVVDQEGVAIGPRDTAEQAFRKVLPCAPRRARAANGRPPGRHRPGDPAGRGAGHLFRRSHSGRRPHRLDENLRANLQSGPRRHRSVPRRFHRGGRLPAHALVAEPDSPAARGRRGRPGEIISVSPLVVATGDGALEFTRTEWRGSAIALKPGQILPSL